LYSNTVSYPESQLRLTILVKITERGILRRGKLAALSSVRSIFDDDRSGFRNCRSPSPNITSRIASALGLNQTSTQKAVVAAVPALLASFISYVSKPQGATKLNEVVKKQEPGVLSSLASVIGEPGQKALIDQGASVS
jgi:hypothetical protein